MHLVSVLFCIPSTYHSKIVTVHTFFNRWHIFFTWFSRFDWQFLKIKMNKCKENNSVKGKRALKKIARFCGGWKEIKSDILCVYYVLNDCTENDVCLYSLSLNSSRYEWNIQTFSIRTILFSYVGSFPLEYHFKKVYDLANTTHWLKVISIFMERYKTFHKFMSQLANRSFVNRGHTY